jgi:hypothetical protein
MWRANLHQRYGYFLDNYKSAGDYEYWLRISGEKNMYYIPQALGLYHARNDGIELADPMTSAQESDQAILLHQEYDGVNYRVTGDYVIAELGNRWSVLEGESFLEATDAIRLRLQE